MRSGTGTATAVARLKPDWGATAALPEHKASNDPFGTDTRGRCASSRQPVGLTAATRRARGRAPFAACARRPSAAPRRFAGGPGRPVDAGREPDQVAPRAYDLVLRAVPADAALRGIIAPFDERFALSVQLLLRGGRPAPCAAAARPDDAAGLSTRSRPIAPMSTRRWSA